MSSSENKPVFSLFPAWGVSAFTAGASIFLPFLFVGIIALIGWVFGNSNEALGDFIAYLCTGIVVAIMCFYICRAHPRSVWYTPVICNAFTLLAGIGNYVEGNVAAALPYAIGWILSVIASIWGALTGNKRRFASPGDII